MKCPIHGTSYTDTVFGCVQCVTEALRAFASAEAHDAAFDRNCCAECGTPLGQRINPSTRCRTCRQRMYRKRYGETFATAPDGHIPRSDGSEFDAREQPQYRATSTPWAWESQWVWNTPINEIPREPPCVTCRTPTPLSKLTLGGRCARCADAKRREVRDAVKSVQHPAPKPQPLRQCLRCLTWHRVGNVHVWRCETCTDIMLADRQLPQECPAPRPQQPPPKPIMRVTATVEAGPVEAFLRRAKGRYPEAPGVNAMQRFDRAFEMAVYCKSGAIANSTCREVVNKARGAIPFGYPRNDHNAIVWFDRLIAAAQKHGA